jgi:hypothetical protein
MVPHHDPTQQSDFPTGEPPRPGDISQPTPPSDTAPAGGTTGPPLPVPCTVILHLLGPDDPDPRGRPLGPDEGTSPVPPPQTCPTCGRAYDLFHHDTSRLLDLILVAKEALTEAQAALEDEVLP